MPRGIEIAGGERWKGVFGRFSGQKLRLDVGVQEGTTGPAGLVAPYACMNEFGTENVPARPFMRRTSAARGNAWAKRFSEALRGRAAEPGAARRAFEATGDLMVRDVVATILSDVPPPNAPSTLESKRRRGAPERTLIDTGGLVSGISAVVRG